MMYQVLRYIETHALGLRQNLRDVEFRGPLTNDYKNPIQTRVYMFI